MYLFDLHCDTITRLFSGERLAPGDRSLRHSGAHLALDRMSGVRWAQCFAIFVPDDLRGCDAVDYFEDCYQFFRDQMDENADLIVQTRTADEIEAALAAGKAAALLTVEGGAALGGDLSMAARLAACGVRMLTLTWNGANELAGGNAAGGGFTPFGGEAVGELERLGIVADVSHLSDRAFWELAGFARRPFVASHSNARAVCPHPRNLTDEQFRRIAQGGGLVGINYCVRFLTEAGDPAFEDVAAHIDHFLDLGGEDTLALGSDFDGADLPSWLSAGEKVRDFYPKVAARFGSARAEKLFFTNAIDFWRRYDGLR